MGSCCSFPPPKKNPVKHNDFYDKNGTIFADICHVFRAVMSSTDEAAIKISMYKGRQQ
jgi:hypothetical protein